MDQTAEHLDTFCITDYLHMGMLYDKLLSQIDNLKKKTEHCILFVEDDHSIVEAIAAHMAQWGLSAEMG